MSETNEPTLSLAEELHQLLANKLGDDWRRDITLTLRADKLYWLVYLAERGIAERKAAFRADPERARSAAEYAASLSSWLTDVGEVVGRVKAVLTPAPKGKKGK